ncbi:tRNA (adenosine(37)-N6)-threonylcarbamoyltransferase complex dimerization subunit type 1 TsaB [Acidithiobacillus sp.]|jgi:tRNA threonylcarbamoyladenosine biosynthesis protein TsaB|uniref:tRNA (adenosine(37)-N6)-threonylcarbamoyltransferase complex dimerization subunit type 1 TsaB n=1 Tax=Acidithiobacillus sp. TaxID=1872118 RepID=UPI0025C0555B|nr:tRNA (adenosine(37)-N6)-threonylcarbamoyltransferase complex dimerization subunit type 1 TsaB [Acidithiobacillus sp.]MCK9189109.1 tRNA (adenosine(37)-N6)-threonylcarbamoyltransferase complex dimerization subunit type 1 TsaB [Acidithiobacillus sp.]MCK9359552.1 tRNA (adenosine(37)-N6)-threonylcarbamoyltransferase complex dimerization subunit type 1 TsaB [Acidithiobacillus sp.]
MGLLRFLAMDTATEACSVAVSTPAGVLEEFVVAANAHSQLLLPMIQRVLDRAGMTLADIGAIACGVGPGGFTGVRIGVSTAQALAMACGLPVYPVSSLQALAATVSQPQVLAALDARKGEVYAGIFRQDMRGIPQLQGAEKVGAPDAVAWPAEGQWWGLGTGWQAYHAHWQGPSILGWSGDSFPRAEAVLRLAQARYQAGDRGIIPALLEPHYIRPSLPEEKQK